MKKLLIIGAGGHGRVCAETAAVCGYEVSFLDDKPGDRIIGGIGELEAFARRFDECFVAMGNNGFRRELTNRLNAAGADIATLIHPTAYVSPSASIGAGTVIEPKALINAGCVIGDGCIISVGAVVDHDAVIGDYSHVNAGAIVKSGVKIQSGRRVDAGETVRE